MLALWVAVVAAALLLRLPDLSSRPMHGDEAVNSWKLAQLWHHQGGETYRYDPAEFHGPTLPILSLPWVRLGTADNYAGTDEGTFRLVTVVFGLLLVILTGFAGWAIGRPAALVGAALAAISPAMVFYSRYYIHETLLVFFTWGAILAGWFYWQKPSMAWALLLGACLGLMHATKETCLIAFFAMGAAAGLSLWLGKGGDGVSLRAGIRPLHGMACLGAGAAISVTLFSIFFTDPQGPWNSIAAFGTYLGRGVGAEQAHIHPWHWYLGLLAWHQPQAHGPHFSEWPILVLAAVGAVEALRRRGLALFLCLYTLLMLVIYSMIPYKTPWCMLGFLHGVILLAGLGAAGLWRLTSGGPGRVVVGLVLAGAIGYLAWQSHRMNFRFQADPRNPHVYAHPVGDVRLLEERARQISGLDPSGRAMLIRVVDGGNHWPIPFYLRQYSQVGYHAVVPQDPDAALIVVNPDLEPALREKLKGDYHEELFGLRPREFRLLLIRQDLWDRFIELQGQ